MDGYLILDAGYWILVPIAIGTGCWILDIGYWTPQEAGRSLSLSLYLGAGRRYQTLNNGSLPYYLIRLL